MKNNMLFSLCNTSYINNNNRSVVSTMSNTTAIESFRTFSVPPIFATFTS